MARRFQKRESNNYSENFVSNCGMYEFWYGLIVNFKITNTRIISTIHNLKNKVSASTNEIPQILLKKALSNRENFYTINLFR